MNVHPPHDSTVSSKLLASRSARKRVLGINFDWWTRCLVHPECFWAKEKPNAMKWSSACGTNSITLTADSSKVRSGCAGAINAHKASGKGKVTALPEKSNSAATQRAAEQDWPPRRLPEVREPTLIMINASGIQSVSGWTFSSPRIGRIK
eukprot:3674285-Amphidinium_carterae.2